MIYDEQYFKGYSKYSGTKEETDLMLFRVKDILEKAFQYLTPGTKNIVDLGCATGPFLRHAQLNMNTGDNFFTGIDINPYCVAYCVNTGVKAFTPEMYDYFCKDKEVDIMTFWDSLEHLRDPKAILDQYKPKIICASMPCLDGFREAFPNEDIQLWKHWKPLEHLWSFDIETLTKFLDNAGYEIVYFTTDESKFRKDEALGDKNIMTVIARRK